tara:strand:+ start:280 stop:879 length:600 start_codon:yes stop_codon:yes gene_type:complete
MITEIVEWTKEVFLPLGSWGLFVLAFMEASFFPVPPDVLLIILALAEPNLALWFALVCTVGSVLGAMFGYGAGYYIGNPILDKLFSENKVKKVHRLFEKYGAWAIVFAAFTPLPFKLFAIAAGVFYMDLKKMVLASFIGRGLRFFLLAGFLMYFGETIVEFLENQFGWVSLGIMCVVIVIAFVVHKYKKPLLKFFNKVL